METKFQWFILCLYIGSYRTYEEWKPLFGASVDLAGYSSYRTYEEWKPTLFTTAITTQLSSYRTYEEWKLPASITL